MQQVRVWKRRTKSAVVRRSELLDTLPLDPRDPDIVRAKALQDEIGGKAAEPSD